MDSAVIKYYRSLLRAEFPNSGAMENPSVFIEAVGEKLINCGNTGNYMQLYLRVAGERITEISYLCACEPVANVAVEVMCDLVKGETLEEAARLTEEPFYQSVGSQAEELHRKVVGLLALLKEGIASYHNSGGAQESVIKESSEGIGKLSWDGTLST